MTRRQLPSKEINGVLQTVPTSPTNFNSVDTYINQIVVNNSNAAARTFTVTDRAATPNTLVPTISIAANTLVVLSFGDSCQYMPGGITWSCSGSNVTASIFGYVAG